SSVDGRCFQPAWGGDGKRHAKRVRRKKREQWGREDRRDGLTTVRRYRRDGAGARGERSAPRASFAGGLARLVRRAWPNLPTEKGWKTMETLSVKMYTITVTFDATTKTFSYSDPSPLSVYQGLGLIVFELKTENGDGKVAEFLTSPIQWFDEGADGQLIPIPQPAAFLVQWFDTSHFTVVDFNSAQVQNQHPYKLVVSFDNTIYGAEPVIINEPVGGPPSWPATSHRR
ncbi:MAG TPA: hypothetical protein VE075_08905, partial [Thermoanaerobaculia bacterium]|nr:hypothetical protein [Thermoanaerobaculia bacterium]